MLGALVLAAVVGASPKVPATYADCELHLFALDLNGVSQPQGNLLVRLADPLALVNMMSPQDRMSDVSNADYRRALGFTNAAKVIRHWDVRIDRAVRKARSPLIATPGQCHVELIGYYSIAMAANRSRSGKNEIVIDLLLRHFDANGAPAFKVDKTGYAGVDAVKKVGRDAALASLRAGSMAILESYAGKVEKARVAAAKKKEGRP